MTERIPVAGSLPKAVQPCRPADLPMRGPGSLRTCGTHNFAYSEHLQRCRGPFTKAELAGLAEFHDRCASGHQPSIDHDRLDKAIRLARDRRRRR